MAEVTIAGKGPQEFDNAGITVEYGATGRPVQSPPEVVLDGVGDPVGADNRGKNVSYGARGEDPIVSPPDAQIDGLGQRTGFDNRGKNVAYGANGQDPVVEPGEVSRSGDVLKDFDNRGINVFEAPNPGAPAGNAKEVKLYSTPVNINSDVIIYRE